MTKQPGSRLQDDFPTVSTILCPSPCAEGAIISEIGIEEYLDHVYAPLVGVVPYARRQELRSELREHLSALVATHQELGSTRDVAVLAALRQFGPPHELARLWACEWAQTAAPACREPAWRAMGIGLGCFGAASLVGLGSFWVDRVHADSFSPGGQLFLWFLSLYLLPIVAGLATGMRARARQALGAFFALALLILLVGLPFGLAYRSLDATPLAVCGLDLAMTQAFLWVPLGCGAAALGGSLRARRARRPARWVLQ